MNNSNDIFNKLKETQNEIKLEKENLLNNEIEQQKRQSQLLQEEHSKYISEMEDKTQNLSEQIEEIKKQNEEMKNLVTDSFEVNREEYKIKYNLDSNFILVSKDGTGDFDSLESAINATKDGDYIFVKYGTYDLNKDKLAKKTHGSLGAFPSSNLKIIGEINAYGMVPIINLTSSISFYKITLRNLEIKGDHLYCYDTSHLENVIAKFDIDFHSDFYYINYTVDIKNSNISKIFTCSDKCIINCENSNISRISIYKSKRTRISIQNTRTTFIERVGLSRIIMTNSEYKKIKDSILGRLLCPIKKVNCTKIDK